MNQSSQKAEFRFIQADVTSFELGQRFNIVFSHQVLEHIAPMDLSTHLASIHNALLPGGKFIVLLPNKHWGPHDITRILDNTFTGRVSALGSHLNESSYTEMIPTIEASGFHNLRTILPLAIHLSKLNSFRVKPGFNLFVEKHTFARKLLNLLRMNEAPIFKNHVVLVCEKA